MRPNAQNPIMPGKVIQQNPYGFMGLALAMGLAAGLYVKLKSARRAVQAFRGVRSAIKAMS